MTALKGANAALMFFLELGSLIGLGYWGFTLDAGWVLRILAGLGAPALFATLWGLFAAGGGQNAKFALHGLARAAFEIAWFGAGAAALYAAGAITWATVFAIAYVVNAVLRLVWNQV
ncbi:YrdB family protein [Streptosporangiaceae bacterium NEAU-GS5]|nr:YrdB family protein [Streptosporangiaceae bacterium NEAU-GS5]